MSTCGKIGNDIAHNCLDKLVQGLEDVLVLINHDDLDLDSCTFDPTNRLICTNLVFKTASPALKGYKVEGYNMSNEHDTALAKKRFINGWEHNILWRIFDNTPEVKKYVADAADSRFVAVIKNKYNNRHAALPGTTVYEILGFTHGLEISEATRNPNDDETMGAWVLRGACDESNKEPDPPYTYFVGGTKAATDTAFEGLYD